MEDNKPNTTNILQYIAKIINVFNTRPTFFSHCLQLDNQFDLLHSMIIKTECNNMETFGHLADYRDFLQCIKPNSFSDHVRFDRYKKSCDEKINNSAAHICYLKHICYIKYQAIQDELRTKGYTLCLRLSL